MNAFIQEAIKILEGDGIAVEMYVDADENADRGYFIYFDTLAVNIAWDDWRETFLHEYCHYLQYKSNAECARKFLEDPLDPAINAAMEQDCELRVVGLLSMLDLDYDDYANRANMEHLVSYFGQEYAI